MEQRFAGQKMQNACSVTTARIDTLLKAISPSGGALALTQGAAGPIGHGERLEQGGSHFPPG
jgi:hypothetical protein